MSIAELPPKSARTAARPRNAHLRPARDRRVTVPGTIPAAERVSALEAVADGAKLLSYRLGFAGIDDPKATAWQVLGYQPFRRYFVGSVISNFGTWLQNTAQVLLAYQLFPDKDHFGRIFFNQANLSAAGRTMVNHVARNYAAGTGRHSHP